MIFFVIFSYRVLMVSENHFWLAIVFGYLYLFLLFHTLCLIHFLCLKDTVDVFLRDSEVIERIEMYH